MDITQLKKLSKIELEELGRTKGIELDRRSNKKTLITQIFSLLKKKPSTSEVLDWLKLLLDQQQLKPIQNFGC